MKTRSIDSATDQAIDWLVKLGSGQTSASDHEAFEAWLQADAAHPPAWDALQSRLGAGAGGAGSIGGVAGALAQMRDAGPAAQLGRQALLAPVPGASRRRMLRGSLALVLGSATAAVLAYRQSPWQALVADVSTSTAERMAQRLPDGSALLLDARSALDIRYSANLRLLHLRAGAVLATVAPLGTDRPFVVQSAQGRVQALGTRFMVRQFDGLDQTLVQVLEHSVRITTRSGRELVLQAGQSARFGDDRIVLEAPGLAADAWAQGVIDVRNQPLALVVDALRPYMPGVLRISPEAAQLPIFGVFSLDDPQRVLQDLVDTQPVTVRHWGSWLTLIGLRHNAD
ncbi:FecR domain-containing protein [Comamonas sp. MYb21]|uniref:FecR family protein n=1 Tax=Comamonas sp. MYb21 TaxID=1848648 RepID=UPI00309CB7A8